ncbi:hypothetical protein F4809DRAFT_637735 [Biscogniauxia mediterranea]|nr:hypothetical protein F4809DRAFT_637735 [Biscogniauxia mediterranea]
MSRKKSKKQDAGGGAGGKKNSKPKQIVRDWETYFGTGELADWQRLMSDLGFQGEEFSSKTQCRKLQVTNQPFGPIKALKGVWVNIRDFLDAVKAGGPVHHFDSEAELSAYTLADKRKIYPKDAIPDGSPLAKLLAHILYPGGGRKKSGK